MKGNRFNSGDSSGGGFQVVPPPEAAPGGFQNIPGVPSSSSSSGFQECYLSIISLLIRYNDICCTKEILHILEKQIPRKTL